MIADTQGLSVLSALVLLGILVGFLAVLILIAVVLTKKYGIPALLGFLMFLMIVPCLSIVAFRSQVKENVQVKEEATANREQALSRAEAMTALDTHADQTGNASFNKRTSAIPPNSAIRVVPIADPPPAAWSSADLGDFQANLYPGLIACTEPLARKIGEAIENEGIVPTADANQKNEQRVLTVYADASLKSDRQECLDLLIDSLAERFPNAQILSGDSHHDWPRLNPKKHELFLLLSASVASGTPIALPPVVTGNRREFHSLRNSTGNVKCEAVGSDGKASATVAFIEKSWVNQFDQLVSEFPHKQFVVGYSQELSSSEALARQSAMENAQSQIRVSSVGGINTLIAESNVVDRFAQKLTRPYGDVWREAVLIDVTGEAMRGAIEIAEAKAARVSSMKRGGVLIAVLLTLAIVAVCFIGNALTQGYYRRPLSWAASTVGALIVLAVIILGNLQY